MILGENDVSEALQKLTLMDLQGAAGRAIKIVQGEAKMLCPVHDGELRDSIHTNTEKGAEYVRSVCYTNKSYGPYVELGTGPKGQEKHEGISPDLSVSYSQSPWWIHESQIDRRTAETYHWFYVDTPQGRFYQCAGQAAQPFMYPALKNQSDKVTEIFDEEMRRRL